MKYAERQRIDWIAGQLRMHGTIGRSALCTVFGISESQASLDLRKFARLHPGAMTYDAQRKRYAANAEHLPVASGAQPERHDEAGSAHMRLNEMGIPNVAQGGAPLTLSERLRFVVSLEHHLAALEHEAIRLREDLGTS